MFWVIERTEVHVIARHRCYKKGLFPRSFWATFLPHAGMRARRLVSVSETASAAKSKFSGWLGHLHLYCDILMLPLIQQHAILHVIQKPRNHENVSTTLLRLRIRTSPSITRRSACILFACHPRCKIKVLERLRRIRTTAKGALLLHLFEFGLGFGVHCLALAL